ncbi:ROK family protein [Rhizobium sp. BK376]|uniref:ROK family protein n=1 Tax=Rhizobium sp. BK376 TaxID=2512149 RepID=UPI00104ACB81|nr:ROK family protein [Rhizobium sp. BK376]TCR67924.1 putative NBD/HSP70 family sugar kinase [Rhizobium sp. BK376]
MQEINKLFLDEDLPAGRLVRGLAASGAATAAQLSKATGLGRSTVSTILGDLREARIVIDVDGRTNGFGRPSQLLSLNPDMGRCAGVLLGLGEIRIVICDMTHTVLSDVQIHLSRDYTPQDAADTVRRSLDAQCRTIGISQEKLLGVGIAISAPLSFDGKVLNSDVLPSWAGVDIAEIFASRLDCPLHAENESHCGALAEMTWGAAIGEADFVLCKFDLGVGGAIVRDNAVVRGVNGSAAEFGHIVLDPQGPHCRCGNRGCLKGHVAGDYLIRLAQDIIGEPVTIDQFVERAAEGQMVYRRLIEDAAEKAGWGMGIIGTILNPPLFVIAGKLAAIGKNFLEPLERSLRRYMLPQPENVSGLPIPRFVVARFLGNDDTVMGAVALVLRQHGKIASRPM